jgi:SSS family solute:Na+ symporter
LSWWPATASGSTASARPPGLASHDYFLAEGSLTWWAIGASLIASNISAEQFIGMSGSGYRIGMAIAVYELMAAATLVIVAVFFMPVYLKHHIYTMPQFLEQRYGKAVATTMALFWLGLYVVVNLTSILYLGALAISSLSGIALLPCMLFLAVFAAIITLGGMKVIGYTDVVQVACLVIGGLVTTWLALDLVASLANGHGALAGLSELYKSTRDHFDMVLTRDNANYMDLPGLSILLGGMWIVNLNYWGCNQYITQRALGADLPTARKGLLFAAFLKLLMPVIVVLPGIAAFALDRSGMLGDAMRQGGELNPDRAYPILLGLLPSGLKGVAFAALTAAVVASLAGKANSIATIFTLDIYKQRFHKDASEQSLVWTGRLTVVVAMLLAVLIAPRWASTSKVASVHPGIHRLCVAGHPGHVPDGLFLEENHLGRGDVRHRRRPGRFRDPEIPAADGRPVVDDPVRLRQGHGQRRGGDSFPRPHVHRVLRGGGRHGADQQTG